MSDKNTSATRPKVVIERSFRARVEELWELWTTKKGFASWWGPAGFRVDVHVLEARVGGVLHYDMIADAPEMIEAMKRMGRPSSHGTRGKFVEIKPHKRLSITHIIDFLPGVKPYESTILVEFFPSGESVHMVITLDPMHDQEFTKMSTMGMTSQLTKLDKRFEKPSTLPALPSPARRTMPMSTRIAKRSKRCWPTIFIFQARWTTGSTARPTSRVAGQTVRPLRGSSSSIWSQTATVSSSRMRSRRRAANGFATLKF